MSSTRKLSVISEKNILKNLDGFKKNRHSAYSCSVIDGKIMVDIASGRI